MNHEIFLSYGIAGAGWANPFPGFCERFKYP